MSSKRAKAKTTKKRPQRATSNVFAMFDQSQIQEFKEAFNMIDQNRDGFIDKEDLHDMLASLGHGSHLLLRFLRGALGGLSMIDLAAKPVLEVLPGQEGSPFSP
ncbi:PREDICTED: myosin regulatory light polypeptide 9-like [Mesitornis unicolor]|uniref:myosin regulatory light polypeptide 9-like n=1 Tax=Mesitornis unicolor TaxID=54374 RepID=UPI0005295999|nr:PREDICTED: myosin regulatory light polypeptide 9-like [Mesitornis unicolor]